MNVLEEMGTSESVASTLAAMEALLLEAEETAEAMSPAYGAVSRLPAGQASNKPSGLKAGRRKKDFHESSCSKTLKISGSWRNCDAMI